MATDMVTHGHKDGAKNTAQFPPYVRSSSVNEAVPSWSSNGVLKVLTSCAAVAVVSLTPMQQSSASNVKISPAPIVVSTEVSRVIRRDKCESDVYVEEESIEPTSDCQAFEGSSVVSETVREEGSMLSPADLDHRERIFKTTVNSVTLLIGAGIASAVFGLLSWVDVVPGVLAGIGVLGSCGIQLNKVDALRKQ
ncbi:MULTISPECIES: hypothetical protein [Aeromonas]|uniref:hypothetical protein n=1 Tax=Aeromonas TaxID=642 RepID=UPI00211D3AD7|nr:hypothetical protein [Aeromonas veronii]UUM70724.1 hypothetical protein NQU90_09825 [Aeromonas veronii]